MRLDFLLEPLGVLFVLVCHAMGVSRRLRLAQGVHPWPIRQTGQHPRNVRVWPLARNVQVSQVYLVGRRSLFVEVDRRDQRAGVGHRPLFVEADHHLLYVEADHHLLYVEADHRGPCEQVDRRGLPAQGVRLGQSVQGDRRDPFEVDVRRPTPTLLAGLLPQGEVAVRLGIRHRLVLDLHRERAVLDVLPARLPRRVAVCSGDRHAHSVPVLALGHA